MEGEKNKKKEKAEIKKENQDFPKIPASSEKIKTEKTVKNEVRETSKLHEDGKTDNTDKK